MMKRLLVLLTFMVAIFGFTAGAFSQVCTSCDKGTVRPVPCPTGVGQAAAACYGFDYDMNNWAAGPVAGTDADGYCDYTNTAATPYRAIFSICDCPDPTLFVVGNTYGIRMTILVDGVEGNNGAYWGADAGTFGAMPANIQFGTNATQAGACGTAFTSAFNTITWYEDDGATVVLPAALNVGTTCAVATTEMAVILEAGMTLATGYTVTGAEGPYWRIDIPPIRIDPAVALSGAEISVNIEIIDLAALGICPSCSICDCTIDVAVVCCGAAAGATTLTFPYFTSLEAAVPGTEDYWNGMVIINPTATVGTATLTAFDSSGDSWTATVTVPANGLYVGLVSSISWTGTATMGEAVFIQAVTDYNGARGFAMMANEHHDSMGYIVPSN